MEATKPSKKYWLYFFFAILFLIFMVVFAPKFFWIALPFVFTFFVRAMNLL